MIETILRSSLCISSTICLWSGFLLAHNWQGVRQRKWLSIALFIWGLAWGLRAYGLIFGNSAPTYDEVLPPGLIVAGIVTSFTFLVWPVSVLHPADIRPRRILIFVAPLVICIALYWGVIGIWDLPCFRFTSLARFADHISYFSVWYRLVMCACLLGYLIYTIDLTVRSIRQYNEYVEENYSEYEKFTIHWIPTYLGGLVAISIFYFINLCFAGYGAFLCHNIVACIFLAWLSAKVMVYNSPFVELSNTTAMPETPLAKGDDFSSRFEWYREQIELWLTTESPYLNSDFSLQEVMKHFGLNRTYASRIFNDGFGRNFIHVVRDYRIAYAKKLIRENPSISMSEVAHQCGYSTAQAFHKAFVYCNDGMTPGKYALKFA